MKGAQIRFNRDSVCTAAYTGVLTWVQYPEDTEATRTTYTYDSMYRMATAACTTDTGLQLNASYVYTDDLLTSITTPSTTYSFSYGDFSLRTGVSIGNRTLATYHYTEESENDRKYDLDRLDYGNGDNVQYEYDDKGRITRQSYEDNSYIAYFYDGDGALAKVYDSQTGITTAYTYDLTGRLVKYAEVGEGHDYSLAYSYNDENQLSTVVEILDGHDRTSTYQYDDDGRITFFEKVLARRRYHYDAFGRVSSTETLGRDYAQIFNTTYSYNDTATSVSSQVSSITHDGPQYDVTYSYTYDDNGNILSVSTGGKTTTYVYDSANQLIRENNQSGSFTHTWTYDNAGNILSRKEYAYTTGSLEGVTPTDTVTYTYGDNQWGDLLTAYDGQTITYDQIGNPLTDGEWTYTWQHGRQLASMSKTDKTWTYTYNADGLRVGRTDGTTNYRYVYDGDKLTFMARNGLYLRFAYTPEGTPLSVLYKGTTYYYVTNLQGDVTAILSQNGYVMVEYTYDAWGNVLTVTGPLKDSLGIYNPLRYRGYVYDQELKIYYLQSRYYDPEVGRFLNADGFTSTGQGLLGNNMFAYCSNNPVIRADLTGKAWYDAAVYWFVDFMGNFGYTPQNTKISNRLNNVFRDRNPLTTTSNRIINDQNGITGSQFFYGNFPIRRNACAPIAVHNVKVLKGIGSTLSDTISDFESTGAIIGNGALGTNPYAIGKVLQESEISYSYVDGPFNMSSVGTYIISFSWDGTINGGAHVVAVQFDGKSYATYNLHCDGKVYNSPPFTYAQHYICGYYLG